MNPLRNLSYHQLALLAFVLYFLIVITDVRHKSRTDPSSPFFDPDYAFTPRYTAARRNQSSAFLESLDQPPLDPAVSVKAKAEHTFCVGIATVQRDGARYFRDAVGSVLEGLTKDEREDIKLVNFIVNIDPTEHVAFEEPWLKAVSDDLLTYWAADNDTQNNVTQVDALPGDQRFLKKPLFDYTFLLEHCYKDGAPWIIMLEDDTIAAEGWYAQTLSAVLDLTSRRGAVEKMIYLRLFYNQRLLGWNSEEWPSYLFYSLLVDILVLATLCLIRRYVPSSSPILTARTILVITFALTPASIALFFLAGRLTVAGYRTGVNKMPNYGCCSQAFVFPRHRIPELIDLYSSHIETDGGYVDMLTERYAEAQGLDKWALTPSVFQHVGSTSSKATGPSRWGRNNAENIWNFWFEDFKVAKRRQMHVGGG